MAPDAGLWLNKDGGKSWTPLEGLPFKNAQRVTFDPKGDSVIYGYLWRQRLEGARRTVFALGPIPFALPPFFWD